MADQTQKRVVGRTVEAEEDVIHGKSEFVDKLESIRAKVNSVRHEIEKMIVGQQEIVDGVLTGEIRGEIIDAEAKGRIIFHLAELERIGPDNIVAVGDGANDCLMIKNAGLGVAFNAKEILKKVSDGTLSRENLLGLLNVLGLAEKEREML